MNSILAPYTAVGIGTEVMPPVFVIDSTNQIYNLGPSRNARVNDPNCKTVASWLAGSSSDHSTKPIVTVRAATPQDFVDRGFTSENVVSLKTMYSTFFLEGWADAIDKQQKPTAAQLTTIRANIENNITCS